MTVEKEGGPGGSGGMNKKSRGGAAAVSPPPIFKDQDSFQFVHRKKDAFEDLCQEKPAGQYAKSRQYHRKKDVSKVSRADIEMDQETPRPSRSGRSSNKQKENNLSRENSLSRENLPIPPSSEVAPPRNPNNKA